MVTTRIVFWLFNWLFFCDPYNLPSLFKLNFVFYQKKEQASNKVRK